MRYLTLALLFLGPTTAFGYGDGTPDDSPPAEEDVCDAYTGSAYGLCNAYCEAMDCDNPLVEASSTACAAVAASFMRKTGATAMPCTPPPECGADCPA